MAGQRHRRNSVDCDPPTLAVDDEEATPARVRTNSHHHQKQQQRWATRASVDLCGGGSSSGGAAAAAAAMATRGPLDRLCHDSIRQPLYRNRSARTLKSDHHHHHRCHHHHHHHRHHHYRYSRSRIAPRMETMLLRQ